MSQFGVSQQLQVDEKVIRRMSYIFHQILMFWNMEYEKQHKINGKGLQWDESPWSGGNYSRIKKMSQFLSLVGGKAKLKAPVGRLKSKQTIHFGAATDMTAGERPVFTFMFDSTNAETLLPLILDTISPTSLFRKDGAGQFIIQTDCLSAHQAIKWETMLRDVKGSFKVDFKHKEVNHSDPFHPHCGGTRKIVDENGKRIFPKVIDKTLGRKPLGAPMSHEK